VKAWALVAVEVLGLAGCVSPLYNADPAAFQAHPRLAIVAFDAYDWSRGRPTSPTRPVGDTLAAAHQAFLAALAHAQLEARDVQVTAQCHGDLGDLCTRLPVAGLSPVNLSPAVAQTVGTSMPADLLVEVHLLTDSQRDGLWSAGAGRADAQTPTLFVRAFNAQGKQVWEDQEMLDMPLATSFEKRWRDYDVAVQTAATRVVARLAEQTSLHRH
jgi:hypothetical protein